jgi:GNAT superfamily N-acetyltransferase
MVELRPVRGPLDDDQLRAISNLYGPVDHKYRSLDYLRHQFVGNPFGWSVHVFAMADERAVGHCGVVPFHARLRGEPAVVGKLEALAVEPEYRGRRHDGGSTATDLLSALYAFAHEQGIPFLFGLAPPGVDRIHVRAGCRQERVDAPAYVLVSDRAAVAQGSAASRRAVASVLAGCQRALVATAAAPLRAAGASPARAAVEQPTAADAALGRVATDDSAWTVAGEDAWDWYVGSGVLKAVDVPDRFGSRALVKLAPHETVQIVAWRAERPTLAAATTLIATLARLVRDAHAPTLRYQPWPGSGPPALAQACRLLGFVRRPEVDLVVHSDGEAFDSARIQLTPFFYVTF